MNANFQGQERAVAFGIWGSTIGGMAALGPLVGGWFVTHLSWRWAFYVNLPIALLALAGAFLFVDESRDPDARARATTHRASRSRRSASSASCSD